VTWRVSALCRTWQSAEEQAHGGLVVSDKVALGIGGILELSPAFERRTGCDHPPIDHLPCRWRPAGAR
jgi:hypothetical protein